MLYIFDWDGTVCDSTGKIVSCMQLAARDLALPELADDVIKNIIGLGLPEALSMLYPDISPSFYGDIKQRYSEHFLKTSESPSDFFPGVVDTLQALKLEGYKLAVATGKSRAGLDRVLKNVALNDFFDATRCADETQSKPHPAMLNELLEMFNLTPNQAVMVGDTEYDMAMAHSIGMPKIGVSYGAHTIDRLHKYELELSVDTFSDILNWKFQQ